MKYCLFIHFLGEGGNHDHKSYSNHSNIVEFDSDADRSRFKGSLRKNEVAIEFNLSRYKFEDILMELVKADPISSIDVITKRAEEVHAVMLKRNEKTDTRFSRY